MRRQIFDLQILLSQRCRTLFQFRAQLSDPRVLLRVRSQMLVHLRFQRRDQRRQRKQLRKARIFFGMRGLQVVHLCQQLFDVLIFLFVGIRVVGNLLF